MTEQMTRSLTKVDDKPKAETRTATKPIAASIIAATVGLLVILGAAVLYAQSHDNEKYSLRSPGGIAFSDFKGYEDWSVVSSARMEDAIPVEILKVILANPTMIAAYKAGVPGNGQSFPEGSMIVKLQWQGEEEHGSAFRGGCARCIQAGFRDGERQ